MNFDCIPVFIDNETLEQFIAFNEITMRPLFHNFKGLSELDYSVETNMLWKVYRKVNETFANIVFETR